MRLKLYTIGWIFLLLPLGVKGQKLEDFLQEAAENNPALKASYKAFEASLQKIPQVKTLPDPVLSFGYFVSPIETRVGAQRAKVSLSQMFPWFGTLKAQGDVASIQADAQFQQFLAVKNKLFLDLKAAYYPLLAIHEQIILQEENLEILETYKSLTTVNYSNAKGSMVDVIRADMQWEEAKVNLQLLKDQLKPLEILLKQLLNRNDSLPVQMMDSLNIDPSMHLFSQEGVSENPLLKSMDLMIQQSDAQKQMVKKQNLPKLGLGLDYVFVSERTDASVVDNGRNSFMPMLSVSLPIYRKKSKAALKEVEFQREAYAFQKSDLNNSLISEYEKASFDYKKNLALDKLYGEQIEKLEQAIALQTTAYSNSGKDFQAILQLQQQLLQYSMQRINAKRDFLMALAQMEYLTAKSE